METLEQKLRKLNSRGNKLKEELTRTLTELETVEKERPQLLLDEIGNATAAFEDRDKLYRDKKANPPSASTEDQQIINFYESLGDGPETKIIKTKLTVHYRRAIARRQEVQGSLEPRIIAGTVVVPYETDKEKGVYVCITVSPQGRNQKNGIIEKLVETVTLGIDGLLDKGEQFVIEDQGKFIQVKLANKDPEDVYEALEGLNPAEFDRANVVYKCIRADVCNETEDVMPSQIPIADANDPSIIYGKDAARNNHMDISTIRRAVKAGTLEPRYVITPGRGGRPRLYVTRESFNKFLTQRTQENGAANT